MLVGEDHGLTARVIKLLDRFAASRLPDGGSGSWRDLWFTHFHFGSTGSSYYVQDGNCNSQHGQSSWATPCTTLHYGNTDNLICEVKSNGCATQTSVDAVARAVKTTSFAQREHGRSHLSILHSVMTASKTKEWVAAICHKHVHGGDANDVNSENSRCVASDSHTDINADLTTLSRALKAVR